MKRSLVERSLTPARVSFVAAGLFLVLLSVLHLVRPDLDPSWNVISVYALGEHGWMMTVAFAALGIACGSAVIALWPKIGTKRGRAGLALVLVSAVGFAHLVRGDALAANLLALVLVSAVGFALGAIFPTDPITATAAEMTVGGQLHQLGATLGGLIPFAALLVLWGLQTSA